jgi:fluoride exporter
LNLKAFLLVGLGGATGSMLRYGIGSVVNRYVNNQFPIGTFSINVVGSLIIGILFGLVARNQWLQEGGMLLLASGFCGGFTTFSTFALENITLMQKGQSFMAILYTGLSIIIGLLLCRVGIWLAS